MSNPSAIAAVTATLESILGAGIHADPNLTDTVITTLPLDQARGSITSNQLNLFLYQVLPNAAWSNMLNPQQVKPGEIGTPPLALDLFYLITTFGRANDTTQPFDHHLLGTAMSVLYDNAVLGPAEIQLAFSGSGLEQQVERVRITLQPLSLDDISKLWTGFATQYRLSVGYEVRVALIDSTTPVTTPLPVLTQGSQNQGPAVQGSLTPPFPALTTAVPPNKQASVRPGEVLTLNGNMLDGTNISVVFNNNLWSTPISLTPNAGNTSNQITVTIPPNPATWPAGFYTVAVMVQRPGETFQRTTNEVVFSLAPSFTITPQTPSAGNITFAVTCNPQVWVGQQVSLLLGSQNIGAGAIAAQTPNLSFAAALSTGTYFVRLRVDGVDSILVDNTVSPPVFDQTQKVTVL